MVPVMIPAAWMIWSRALSSAVVNEARSGSISGRSRMASVHAQQRPDLLDDPGRIPAAERTSANDRGFQFAVRRLDLPPFVVERYQLPGGCLARVPAKTLECLS